MHTRPTTNEIEKALRTLWDFDSRFFGEILGFDSDSYEWAVYSLCYLFDDEAIIEHLLNIYVPLLGRHISATLGDQFRMKIGRTFMDDVGHYLWDVQGLEEAQDLDWFDWHRNRNDFSLARIATFLEFAGLPALPNPDFPPSWVMPRFANLHGLFNSELEYLQGLHDFYADKGYAVSL